MPFDKSKYPLYWNQFSKYIRYERARNKCERCGAANGDYKYISPLGTYFVSPDDADKLHQLESWLLDIPKKTSRIVLTVAHLDGKSGICFCLKRYGMKCAKPEHVMAMCQACHLSEDMNKHIARRRKNLAMKKDLKRGLFNLPAG